MLSPKLLSLSTPCLDQAKDILGKVPNFHSDLTLLTPKNIAGDDVMSIDSYDEYWLTYQMKKAFPNGFKSKLDLFNGYRRGRKVMKQPMALKVSTKLASVIIGVSTLAVFLPW